MKVFVYAIYEPELEEIYVGISKDVDQRLSEHKRGKSKYTKKFNSLKLFYTEESTSYSEARKREKYFKNASGKEYLRQLLKNAGIV